jgi:hypothetical protein
MENEKWNNFIWKLENEKWNMENAKGKINKLNKIYKEICSKINNNISVQFRPK